MQRRRMAAMLEPFISKHLARMQSCVSMDHDDFRRVTDSVLGGIVARSRLQSVVFVLHGTVCCTLLVQSEYNRKTS